MSIRRSKEYAPSRKNIKSLSDDLIIYNLNAFQARSWKLDPVLIVSVNKLYPKVLTSYKITPPREFHCIGKMNFSSSEHLPTLEGYTAPGLTMPKSLRYVEIAYRVLIKPNLESVELLFNSLRK